MNQTYAYSRYDRKIKFRMVSAQHFINEAPGVFQACLLSLCPALCIKLFIVLLLLLVLWYSKLYLTFNSMQTHVSFLWATRHRKERLGTLFNANNQCWGKLLLELMHYNIALLPKK